MNSASNEHMDKERQNVRKDIKGSMGRRRERERERERERVTKSMILQCS